MTLGRMYAMAATTLAALATALAVFAYVDRGDGVAYSGGAEFAAILCGVALVCSLALRLVRRGIAAVGLGLVLTVGLIGAAVAAYFLNTWDVLACLALSAFAWLAAVVLGASGRGRAAA